MTRPTESGMAGRVAELEATLRDLLSEFGEVQGEFERLKRAYEPPYVAHASWAAPAAHRLLRGELRSSTAVGVNNRTNPPITGYTVYPEGDPMNHYEFIFHLHGDESHDIQVVARSFEDAIADAIKQVGPGDCALVTEIEVLARAVGT